MLNQISVMGRFTKTPELKATKDGVSVVGFTLAVDRDVKNASGKYDTDFIDCVAWRQTAEFVNSYFSKGSMAIVLGRLQVRDWTDNQGNKRRQYEIVCDRVYFGSSKSTAEKTEQSKGFEEIDEVDGELPF